MLRTCLLVTLLVAAATGCAGPRPSAGLEMPAPDEAHAASLLAGYLLGQGWSVQLADGTAVEAARGDETLRLEPQLDPRALDRIVLSRTWPRAEGTDDEALRDFALELNDALNVGLFRAAPAGLEFQSWLPFLEVLEPRLLDAYLDYTADVRLAVLRVQGDRRLLAPVEDDESSR